MDAKKLLQPQHHQHQPQKPQPQHHLHQLQLQSHRVLHQLQPQSHQLLSLRHQ